MNEHTNYNISTYLLDVTRLKDLSFELFSLLNNVMDTIPTSTLKVAFSSLQMDNIRSTVRNGGTRVLKVKLESIGKGRDFTFSTSDVDRLIKSKAAGTGVTVTFDPLLQTASTIAYIRETKSSKSKATTGAGGVMPGYKDPNGRGFVGDTMKKMSRKTATGVNQAVRAVRKSAVAVNNSANRSAKIVSASTANLINSLRKKH